MSWSKAISENWLQNLSLYPKQRQRTWWWWCRPAQEVKINGCWYTWQLARGCAFEVYTYIILYQPPFVLNYKLYVEVRTPNFLTIECPLIPSCDIQKKRRVTWWSETTTPEVLGLLGAGGGWKTQRVVRCFVWLDSNRGHLGFPSRYRWQWTNKHQRNVAKNPRLKKSEVYVSSCFLLILGLFLRRKGVSHWSMEFWWWRVQRFDPGILSTGPKFNTLKRGHPQTKSHFSQCSVYLKGLVVSDFCCCCRNPSSGCNTTCRWGSMTLEGSGWIFVEGQFFPAP